MRTLCLYVCCYSFTTANERACADAPRHVSDAPPNLVGSTEDPFRRKCISKILIWIGLGVLFALQRMRRNGWRK